MKGWICDVLRGPLRAGSSEGAVVGMVSSPLQVIVISLSRFQIFRSHHLQSADSDTERSVLFPSKTP